MGSSLPAPFPTTSGNADRDSYFFDADGEDEVPESSRVFADRLYFVQRLSGYCGDFDSAPILEDALDNIRCFYGACLAAGLLTEEWGDKVQNPHIVLHRMTDKNADLVHTDASPDDIQSFEGSSGAAGQKRRMGRDSDKVTLDLAKIISNAFSKNESARLKTSCMWLFRAYNSRSRLDSVLESMIAIESLLGDRRTSEKTGLGDLLANRTAYILGKNKKERDAIIEKFKSIYKLRSAIVHSGTHRVAPRERAILAEARTLCQRVISKEMQNS